MAHSTLYGLQCELFTVYSVQCKMRSAMQCTPVQCSAVQCSGVQCSAVQCSAVQCSAVQCSAVQCSAVPCSAVVLLSPSGASGAGEERLSSDRESGGDTIGLMEKPSENFTQFQTSYD